MRTIRYTNNKKEYNSILHLCNQSPLLVINTSCGIGRYRFNMITYDDKDRLVLKFKLINDDRYKATRQIEYKLGRFYYLSAKQFLYAFKYFANS